MKNIQLTQGKVAIVDDADFEWLSQWPWFFSTGYAIRREGKLFGRKNIMMHRLIMNTPEGMDTDHINGDKLDNRRENLRVCTRSQNMQNTTRRSDNTSGYKGVDWDKENGKWRAEIKVDSRRINLGRYDSAEEAALAYDRAAREYHGEFANTNF
jgi:hypothetical protein